MRLLFMASIAMVVGLSAGQAGADLTPDQIAIIVRRADAQGPIIARYYCEQRAVPRENIIVIDAPGNDELSWSTYRSKIVEPLRAALKRKQEGSIRCLLLAGNWPLAIVPDPPTAADKHEVATLREYVPKAALELYQQAWRVDQISSGNMPGRAPDKMPGNIRNTWEAEGYYFESLARAWNVVNNLPPEKGRQLSGQLASIRKAVEGQLASIDPEPRDHTSADFRNRRGLWQKAFDEKVRPALEKELGQAESQCNPKIGRDTRRRKVLELRGLAGLIRQVYVDIDDLVGGARNSALDSELALLYRDNYRLHGSQGNPLRRPEDAKDAVMTIRLDGFDRGGPIKIIDDSIAIEKAGQGVVGKLCLDGQGLAATDPHKYDDQLILDVADWKDRPTWMPLVKESSLAAIAGAEASPVAFYLGWGTTDRFPAGYNAARGAVAISCMTDSMAGLHDARSKHWCNGWLSGGAAAVIGVVDNCLPRDVVDGQAFLKALFVDGKPLAEAYWLSARSTSWRVIVVGDPLYRPGARKPAEAQPGK